MLLRATLKLLPLAVVLAGCAAGPLATSHEPASFVGQRTVAEVEKKDQPAYQATPTDATPAAPTVAAPTPEAIAIPGSDLVHGRATVVVKAPIDKVREAVLGFAHYPEFMPHYTAARVIGPTSGGKEVYMQIEALHGAVSMSANVEVPKPAMIDGVETYDTKFLKGNVDDFKAVWRMKKIDDQSTELSLEVFLKPKLPLPHQLINSENMNGAVKGVVAMRARLQGDKLSDD
jgi:ribosome-associated toxin RatA of RatAB toxin-antitoxin module